MNDYIWTIPAERYVHYLTWLRDFYQLLRANGDGIGENQISEYEVSLG